MLKKTITAREANQRFSKVLREVQDGYEFLVTRKGRPVARISAVAADGTRVLTPEQERAAKRLIKGLRRGWPLGIGRFSRDEIYDERIARMKMFRK
jgi:prevent-host-death family protein